MSICRRLFLEHPESVDETYGRHFVNAIGFGARMVWGGLVCMAHAFVPGLWCTKGSEMVCELHDRMVTNRRAAAEAAPELESRRAA